MIEAFMKGNRWIFYLIVICVNGFYPAIGIAENTKTLPGNIVEVQRKIFINPLFFSSTIQPIKQYNVTTPNEGTVVEKFFDYGQFIKKGATLVKINSLKLEADYHNALTQYLNNKEKFFSDEAKFKSTDLLYKQGIVPEDEIKNAKSSLLHSNVAYLQALYTLNETVKIGQELAEDVTKLDISDIEAVEKALKIKYNHLNLTSPEDGIALYPPDTGSSRGEMIEIGSQLKHGQVVAIIGDLTGIKLKIQVTEIDVGQIKEGLKAEVTGVAFPGHVLEAEVKRVDLQASSDMASGGGLPTFGVDLEVAHLTDEQRKDIRVGMSTKIKLNIEKQGAIEIPIQAVQKEGKIFFVSKVDENDNITRVPIITGQTTQDTVEVKLGLENGDRILIPDQVD